MEEVTKVVQQEKILLVIIIGLEEMGINHTTVIMEVMEVMAEADTHVLHKTSRSKTMLLIKPQ